MATPKVDIWMPIYIGDYLRDTQNLTAEENGVYLLLLMYYWQKKGCIGSDIHRLSIVGKATEETTKYILETFFTLSDGNYKNKRADKELAGALSRSESARANVNKRWKNHSNTAVDTVVLPAYNDGNTADDTELIRNGYSSSSSSSSSSKEEKKREETDTCESDDSHSPLLDFNGVKMSRKSFDGLCKRWDKSVVLDYCERVHDYCQSKRKKYSDYAGAVRNFIKRDKIPEKYQPPKQTPLPVCPSCEEIVDLIDSEFAACRTHGYFWHLVDGKWVEDEKKEDYSSIREQFMKRIGR